jgi:glycosyltransferase involved in cell wall biosynthesis
MNILLWSPNGAGLHYGGAGTNAYRLYASSCGAEHRVTLACACPEQEDYDVFSEVVQIHRRNSQTWYDHLIYLYKAKRWLTENASRFDIFHGIDIFENTIRPACWAEQLGLPAVVKPAVAGSGLAPAIGVRRFLRLPEKRRALVSQLSGIVSISAEIRRELTYYGVPESRIYDIPNGVDVARFSPVSSAEKEELRHSFGWESDEFVVLFVGAVTPRKRPEWVLQAAVRMLESGHKIRAVLVGPSKPDDYIDDLKSTYAEQFNSGAFQFLGLRKDVADFYRAADVYCLPSMSEGMPNSVLEALSSGLPSLVTRISGSEDLIDDGVNGEFVGTVDELANQLNSLICAPDRLERMGHNAREGILGDYSSASVFSKYIELFESQRRR